MGAVCTPLACECKARCCGVFLKGSVAHIRSRSLLGGSETVAKVAGRAYVQLMGNPVQGDDHFGAQPRSDPQLFRVRLRELRQLHAVPSTPVQFLSQNAFGILFGGLPPLRPPESRAREAGHLQEQFLAELLPAKAPAVRQGQGSIFVAYLVHWLACEVQMRRQASRPLAFDM